MSDVSNDLRDAIGQMRIVKLARSGEIDYGILVDSYPDLVSRSDKWLDNDEVFPRFSNTVVEARFAVTDHALLDGCKPLMKFTRLMLKSMTGTGERHVLTNVNTTLWT